MKTLIFCTSWAENKLAWQYRYAKWLQHVRQSGLVCDQILMVDDGSASLPQFEGLTLLDAEHLPAQAPTSPAVLAHFTQRLGRDGRCNYPGWWRSFMFAADYAARYGFTKIVHVESDTFVLSPRLTAHINALNAGWTAFWCPRWQLAESCLQVIGADQLPAYQKLAAQPYEPYIGQMAEQVLPFTQVEKSFTGDRYGEYRTELPPSADYAAQVPCSTPVWHQAPPSSRRVLALTLGTEAVPPHPELYPYDAWQPLGYAAPGPSGSPLAQALAQVSTGSLNALQITLSHPNKQWPLTVGAIERVLGPRGELVINMRHSFSKHAFQGLIDALLDHGFAISGAKNGTASGDWIVADCHPDSQGADPLMTEHFNLRRDLVAELAGKLAQPVAA